MFVENYEDITDCIVLDTETVTDMASGISKVWELGVVVIKNVDIVETYNWVISPKARFDKLDLWYPEDHITVDKIKTSPSFEDLIDEMLPFLNENLIIGGHNVDYDLRMLNQELNVLGLPLIGAKKFDTIRLAKKVHPDWTRYKLDVLAEAYGLSIENRHRALDDAYATAVAFLKMREQIIQSKNNPIVKEEFGLF